jgi:predicted lipoprotein with Yx(FWY)xxD motif
MRTQRPVGPAVLGALTLLVAAFTLAACGSSSPSASTTTTRPTPTTHATTTASAPTTTSLPPGTTTTTAAAGTNAATSPIYEVKTGTVKGLGTVLVDGAGFTLYLFVPDKQSGKSTCYGPCANGWPPLLLPKGVTSPIAGPGVQTSLLGTTQRTDGTTEVMYNHWPLYLWVNDSQPGQATGQGINSLGGLWYALAPDGKAITTKPQA